MSLTKETAPPNVAGKPPVHPVDEVLPAPRARGLAEGAGGGF